LTAAGRRRLALSLAGLVAVPALLLAACGNAGQKTSQDNRPDARSSTNGARVEYPEPVGSIPIPVVSGTPLSGINKQQAPAGDQYNQIPPEDLVSQQGFGEAEGG